MKKYCLPVVMLVLFETIALTLWLTKDNLFYLFNFSYIGISISLGIFLYIREYRNARRIAQLLVGCYMLVYLGLICGENMQIEGFWYYLRRQRSIMPLRNSSGRWFSAGAGAVMPAGRQ